MMAKVELQPTPLAPVSENPQPQTPQAEPTDVVGMFLQTVRDFGGQTAAIVNDGGGWAHVSWNQLELRARKIAAGLVALGVKPGDRVAILGETTLTWVLCELGAQMAGAISAPIYQTNPVGDVRHILRDSGAVVAFGDRPHQLDKLVEAQKDAPSTRTIIAMEPSQTRGVMALDDLVRRGGAAERDEVSERIAAIGYEDPACFIYTSGTTGEPKGVVLTHANWVYEADVAVELELNRPGDQGLMYLPMAHSYAQALKAVWFRLGHPVGFARSLDTLLQDFAAIRPTVLASVPRIFEKVYTKVVSAGQAAPGARGHLFRWAMQQFERYVAARKEGTVHDTLAFRLAKRLVFQRVAERLHAAFGGRIRYFVSGGAPLAPKIAYFFELCGLEILEGYGLTETSAGAFVNRPGHGRIGTVGVAFPKVETKIAPDGEILMRGPNLMRGYHERPEQTREAIDEDGWFHTGDIGDLDAQGFLRITDRKKDLIVTAGGKNVAPQKIENRLKTHPLISQVVVHGDRRKFLSALITLDPEASLSWATERGIATDDPGAPAQAPAMLSEVDQAVSDVNAGLASYETIKKFAVLPDDFTQESGELTPTLKVKRRVVEQRHASILDGLYAESFDP